MEFEEFFETYTKEMIDKEIIASKLIFNRKFSIGEQFIEAMKDVFDANGIGIYSYQVDDHIKRSSLRGCRNYVLDSFTYRVNGKSITFRLYIAHYNSKNELKRRVGLGGIIKR